MQVSSHCALKDVKHKSAALLSSCRDLSLKNSGYSRFEIYLSIAFNCYAIVTGLDELDMQDNSSFRMLNSVCNSP